MLVWGRSKSDDGRQNRRSVNLIQPKYPEFRHFVYRKLIHQPITSNEYAGEDRNDMLKYLEVQKFTFQVLT